MKMQAAIVLQGRIVATDLIQTRQQIREGIGTIQIPVSRLIFLRIEIFLGPGAESACLSISSNTGP